MLHSSIYVATVILIPKPNEKTIKKEFYRSVFFMSIDAGIFNKILTNQIQEHIKKTNKIHHRDEERA